jgi:DNA ligase-1
MAKRGLSVDDAKSPSKKRAKSGAQSRLDTFFNTSPTKPRLTQSNASSPATQQVDGAGDTVSQPFVIDVDANDVEKPAQPKYSTSTPKGKGKEIQRQLIHTKTRPLQFAPLDIDPVTYSPEQPWLTTGAPYAFLAHALSTLSSTRSRISIVNTLTNCLHTIIVKHPESLLPSLYLLSNTIAPPYASIELGLGPSIISRAIQNVSGATPATLKRLYNTLGDPGDVALAVKSNIQTLIPHPPLTISTVYTSLRKVAQAKGQGATKQKEKIVEKLLLSAQGEEVRYLTRTLGQNIRAGSVRTSMLTALARSAVLYYVSPEVGDGDVDVQVSSALLSEARKTSLDVKKKTLDSARVKLNEIFTRAEGLVKGVFVKHPNYDDIVAAILSTGLLDLKDRVPLTIGP